MREDRFQVDRDILFMSAYPNAMTGFRCERLPCNAGRRVGLLPVLYTTIRMIGNPLDMVASGERGDRRSKKARLRPSYVASRG